jgi:hypothetical protein
MNEQGSAVAYSPVASSAVISAGMLNWFLSVSSVFTKPGLIR